MCVDKKTHLSCNLDQLTSSVHFLWQLPYLYNSVVLYPEKKLNYVQKFKFLSNLNYI